MLGHIYYTLALIPLLMTLAIIIKLNEYNKIKEWYSKFEEITKSKPKKEDFRSVDEYGIYAGTSGIMYIDFIWVLLGLLTASWYVFLSILAISIVVNILKKIPLIKIMSPIFNYILLSVKFSVYLYLIINHFHLHNNTWQMVIDYIK